MRFSAVLLLLLVASSVIVVRAQTQSDLRSALSAAYSEVSRAEAYGGDVGPLVSKLDEAAQLIDSGSASDLVKAQGLIADVSSAASGVGSQGAQSTTTLYFETGVSLVVLAALAVLVWRFGPRVFWGVWLRGKRGWRVESA
jgi:hypothetical protein